jgi:hypothetical protein
MTFFEHLCASQANFFSYYNFVMKGDQEEGDLQHHCGHTTIQHPPFLPQHPPAPDEQPSGKTKENGYCSKCRHCFFFFEGSSIILSKAMCPSQNFLLL